MVMSIKVQSNIACLFTCLVLTSSPSCASFALKRTAEDNKTCFHPEVIDTIRNSLYVDDCLKSMPSEQDTLQLVKDLSTVCHMGGFHLTTWVSNSRTVLSAIPEEDKAKEMKTLDLDKDKLPMERALGLQWSVENDAFMFKITVKERPHTRRGMLSVVSSVYDPFGFLVPLTLPVKSMLQELCKQKYGWDEKIPQATSKKWTEWTSSLKRLADVCLAASSQKTLKNQQASNCITFQTPANMDMAL